jgi:hypothetical protein
MKEPTRDTTETTRPREIDAEIHPMVLFAEALQRDYLYLDEAANVVRLTRAVRVAWPILDPWVDPTLLAFLRDHSDPETGVFKFGAKGAEASARC